MVMPIAIALDTVLALFKRFRTLIPLALLAMALAVQTARIEGFLWWDGYKADRAKFAAERAQWAEANRINRASIDTLIGAITVQTDAVRKLADERDRRTKAAAEALGRAEKRAAGLEALAVRIERERAVRAPAGKCETGRAVIEARGEL